ADADRLGDVTLDHVGQFRDVVTLCLALGIARLVFFQANLDRLVDEVDQLGAVPFARGDRPTVAVEHGAEADMRQLDARDAPAPCSLEQIREVLRLAKIDDVQHSMWFELFEPILNGAKYRR